VELVAFSLDAAQRHGDIRSRERIRPADAIQLACASAARTDLFVTNDNRLSGMVVSGVTFVTGLERVPSFRQRMAGPRQRLEFLAKQLTVGTSLDGCRVVVGTPLYVALAE